MATKSIQKKTLIKRADAVKAQVKKLNTEAINTSDALVEEALVTGEQWQKIFAKAMKSSTVLMGKQQDMLLTTLETLKGQFNIGSGRMSKLLSLNWRKSTELKTRVNSKKRKATAKVDETIDQIVEKAVRTKKKTAKAKVTTTKTAKKAVAKVVKAAKVVTTTDDLTKIEGIGPKVAEHFNKAGITTFAQLAASDLKTLKDILSAAGPRYKMRNPSTWPQQAKLAAKGNWDKLKALQGELKGGVRVKK